MKAICIAIFSLIVLKTCGSENKVSYDEKLLEGEWTLSLITSTSFDGRNKPTLIFDTGNQRVSGRNSCNSYSGTYKIDESALTFNSEGMMMTKMYCENSIEKLFMDALQKTDNFGIEEEGKVLVLSHDDSILLKFERK